MIFSRIIATGSYLPEKVLTNHDIEKLVNTTDDWIVGRTGIKRRHIADADETSATMALRAAEHALEKAGISREALDLIIVATCTPEQFFPSTACLVQQGLGIQKPLPAFDISAACAGFIYGLSIADQYIRSGIVKTALVIGSELMSRIVDWSDRKTCVLFGDGAGAVILSEGNQPGIILSKLLAHGKYKKLLYLANKATQHPQQSWIPPKYVQMEGHEVFKLAVNLVNDVVEQTIQESEYQKSDINWLVPHQANLRIIKAAARKLNMSMERVILTIEDHGNTSAASIPLALDHGIQANKIKPGHLLLFEAFGAGLAWGSTLLRL